MARTKYTVKQLEELVAEREATIKQLSGLQDDLLAQKRALEQTLRGAQEKQKEAERNLQRCENMNTKLEGKIDGLESAITIAWQEVR